MEFLKIKKTKKLKGIINIKGSKNSTLPLIAASLLVNGKVVLDNTPNITDINNFLEIINSKNINYYTYLDTLTIYSKPLTNTIFDSDLITSFRASYYLMGICLSRYKYIRIKRPGGCKIGQRPIDYHLEGFKKLGASIEYIDDEIEIKCDNLVGCDIKLSKKSVGATINLIFASVYASGVTNIFNPSLDVEVIDVINFLNKLGFKIKHSKNKISIKGVNDIINIDNIIYSVIPDRIETLSYVVIGLLFGELIINNINFDSIKDIINLLKSNNANIKVFDNYLIVKKSKINNFDIITGDKSFIHTDISQILGLLFLKNYDCISYVEDNIFENRYESYLELNKLGANTYIDTNKLYIKGVKKLKGNKLYCKDLRGSLAIIIASLMANGSSFVYDYHFVYRGYDNIINNLINLGANIKKLSID